MLKVLEWFLMGMAFTMGFVIAASFALPIVAIGAVVFAIWGVYWVINRLVRG